MTNDEFTNNFENYLLVNAHECVLLTGKGVLVGSFPLSHFLLQVDSSS